MPARPAVASALLITLCLPPLARAEGEADGPRLALETKQLDFGEVVQGESVDLSVAIRSAGSEPLVIQKVETTCGCTVSRFPREPIPPGGEAALELRFDSTSRSGMQSFSIEVYSNDPTQDDRGRFCTLLSLRGEVRTLFRAAPAGAFFGELVRGVEAATRTVTIRGVDEASDGFEARLETELPDYLEARLEPGEGPTVRLEVTVHPHVPRGELHHVLEIATGVPTQPSFEVPVVAIVTGRITGPDFVQFYRLRRGETTERRVQLQRRDGGHGIPVRRVDFDRRLLDVATERVSADRLDLVLRLRPDAPPGPFATRVAVHLDDPEDPLLEFPVFGDVAPRVQVEPPVLLVPAGAAPGPVGALTVRGGTVLEARVAPEGGGLEVEVGPVEGGRQRLEVRATGPVAADGRIVLVTDVEREERVAVPVRRLGAD